MGVRKIYLGLLFGNRSSKLEKENHDMKCINGIDSSIFRASSILFVWLIVLTGCQPFDNQPRTLHMAAFKGDVQAATTFINNGISVNAQGPDGGSPLHFAVFGNKMDMVKFLLDQGAHINGIDSTKSTPLHGAAWKGHTEVAEFLIARGADLSITNKMGKTPLDWAVEYGHDEVATLIGMHDNTPKEQDQP